MSDDFKRCIDITPNGVLNPGSRQDYLWLRGQEWWEELLIDTRCIRLWVDRPSLQGDASNHALGSAPNGSLEALRLQNLDAQIRAANADGLEVILLPYRYPLAANGTLNLPVENRLFEPQDRASGNAYLSWYYDRTQPAPNMKDLHYRLPPDGHRPDSEWGRFVRAMFERWVARSDVHGRADAIEVCNEPNGQLWPQRGPAADTSTIEARLEVSPAPPYRVILPPTSEMTVHKAVAEMMQTVDEYARFYSPGISCFAPSTADTDVMRTMACTGPDALQRDAVELGAQATINAARQATVATGCHWAAAGGNSATSAMRATTSPWPEAHGAREAGDRQPA